MDNKKYDKLLAPGRIGKLRIKNRIVKTCGGAEDIGVRNMYFLESIARGGAGLIIWGDVAVEHPRGITIPITQRHLEDETNLPAMRKIACNDNHLPSWYFRTARLWSSIFEEN